MHKELSCPVLILLTIHKLLEASFKDKTSELNSAWLYENCCRFEQIARMLILEEVIHMKRMKHK